jgi:hypothetical protein
MDTDNLKALALAASAGPWKWWTSNSTLRLTGADGKDGGVLSGTCYRGVGDISCSAENRAFIEASNPATVLALIAEVERLRADAERYRWLRDKANSQLGRAPMVFNCNPEDSLCWTDSLHGARLDAVMDVFVDAAIEKEKA